MGVDQALERDGELLDAAAGPGTIAVGDAMVPLPGVPARHKVFQGLEAVAAHDHGASRAGAVGFGKGHGASEAGLAAFDGPIGSDPIEKPQVALVGEDAHGIVRMHPARDIHILPRMDLENLIKEDRELEDGDFLEAHLLSEGHGLGPALLAAGDPDSYIGAGHLQPIAVGLAAGGRLIEDGIASDTGFPARADAILRVFLKPAVALQGAARLIHGHSRALLGA